MTPLWTFARSAIRAHRVSLAGTIAVVFLASTMLTATGVWVQIGVGSGADDSSAPGVMPMLATLASSFAGTTVLLVIVVMSSTITATLGQRRHEFALLRTIGATRRQVWQLIRTELILLTTGAGLAGLVPGLILARLLTPLLVRNGLVPEGFTVGLSLTPIIATAAILLPTALVAARVGARQLLRAAPIDAARQGTDHPARSAAISRPRRLAALITAGFGAVVAATPLAFPGTLGSATGAASALLLVTAAALAGPLLVARAAAACAQMTRAFPTATVALAVANARGFSRRLTTAIVPLALLLTLGTVQLGLNTTMATAATGQLREGLDADMVASSELEPDQLERIAAIDEVTAVSGTSVGAAEVRIDQDEDMPALMDGLLWEPAMVRTLAGVGDDAGDERRPMIDPDLAAGSLDELDQPGTVAVSADATIGTGNGVGGTVDVRFADGHQEALTIVAVYERGLGFGDYLIGPATGADIPTQAAFLQITSGAHEHVRAELEAIDIDVSTRAEFIDAATDASMAEQDLSESLLVALLFFLGLASINTLIMLTASRRSEFQLLCTTGATRRQVLRVVTLEAIFIAVTAVVLGTITVIPPLAAASIGLLGVVSVPIGGLSWGILAGAVAVIAFVFTLVPAWVTTQRRRPLPVPR